VSKYAGAQGSFALSIAEFVEKSKQAIDSTIREVVIEIGNSVIRMSPVDTGRFRGNWQFSIDAPAAGTLSTLDPTGGQASARLAADSILLKAGHTFFVVNNLPYAIPLEYGHSDQAPGGMVRITLARFQRIIEEAIRNNQI